MYSLIGRTYSIIWKHVRTCSFRKSLGTLSSLQYSDPNIRKYNSSTSEEICPPVVEGTSKEYSRNIHEIVEQISRLSLLEVADLNDLLKSTLKITETPMMALGGTPSVKQEETETEIEAPVKSLYSVKLIKFDASKKVALIKEVKNQIEGMNLVQAKKFVEALPQSVKADVTKEEAETLKTTLETVGGSVQID